MAWSRFEPGFSRHPKRIKVGPIASWLWVASVDHCTEFRTNGFIDDITVPTLCPTLKPAELRRQIDALLGVRSWERVDSGYLVHGYLEHNPSAEQVEADRQAAKDRYRKWRDNKRSDNGVANALATEQDQRVSNGSVPYRSVVRSFGHRSKEPPVLTTRSTTREPSRAQTGDSGIAHAIDSTLEPAHEPRESTDAELQIIATAMGISIAEARERQREARRRGL
jgi:hypothetical protein